MTEDVTEDLFFGGRLRLAQPRRGHRAGGDAALLVAAARSRLTAGAAVVDLGAGVGAVGLALTLLGAARTVLVEIDPGLASMASCNAEANGLADRARAEAADVEALATAGGPERPAAAAWDLVVCNPPFDDASRHRSSPDAGKARAHIAGAGLIEGWIGAAGRLLRPGGSLVMINRPDALGPIVSAAEARRFGDIRVLPLHPRAEAPAARIIVAARKGRRGPLALLPQFVLHGPDGAFTAEADRAQRGEAALDLR